MKHIKIENGSNIAIGVGNKSFGSGSGFYEVTSSFYFPPVVKYGYWKYNIGSESFSTLYVSSSNVLVDGDILPSKHQNKWIGRHIPTFYTSFLRIIFYSFNLLIILCSILFWFETTNPNVKA